MPVYPGAPQDCCILELGRNSFADPGDSAAAAMRGRIRARFAQLHADREQLETQLAALVETTPRAADPGLLEELPLAGDILPGLTPELKAGVGVRRPSTWRSWWNKPGQQATVFAEITDATLKALTGIRNPSKEKNDDTPVKSPGDPDSVEYR